MKQEKIIRFMSQRYIVAVFSIVLLIGSVVSLVTQGLNFGLDFTGGTLVELQYKESADLNGRRAGLEEAGYSGAVGIQYGSEDEALIRLQQTAIIGAVDGGGVKEADSGAEEEVCLGDVIPNR